MEQTFSIYPDAVEIRNDSIQNTVRKERGKLLKFIRNRVANDEDAEDILQDVFYQFVNVMQIDNIEKAASWLFKVAGNKITDWYRKNKPISLDRLNGFGIDDENLIPLNLEDILYDPIEDPDMLYLRSTVWPMLSDALNDLPDEQREVFIMHELEDKSFKEISELTGVPVNTLLSRKRYAILFLREKLEDLYEEFFND
jgi:RNA polymerase sigma factor (sigma-70 family)